MCLVFGYSLAHHFLLWDYHRANSGETRRVCATYENSFGGARGVTLLIGWNSAWVLRVNILIAAIHIENGPLRKLQSEINVNIYDCGCTLPSYAIHVLIAKTSAS